MKRLTHEHCNGFESGYWSAAKKDVLIARLAQYENTGVPPEKICKEWNDRIWEPCPNCGEEVHIIWDVKLDGYEIFCPRCGEKMMLCDECIHADDYRGCDWDEGGCYRSRGENEDETT